MDTALLICEGTCNPNLGELDAVRRAATSTTATSEPDTPRLRALPSWWLRQMREVVYRPHVREAPGFMSNIWTCQSCGATRRW
jgi:hypothetical protein